MIGKVRSDQAVAGLAPNRRPDIGATPGGAVWGMAPVPGALHHGADQRPCRSPRVHLAVVGDRDPLTPPEGVDRIDAELREVYGRLGHPDRWKLLRYDVGHEETSEARLEILEFLDQHL